MQLITPPLSKCLVIFSLRIKISRIRKTSNMIYIYKYNFKCNNQRRKKNSLASSQRHCVFSNILVISLQLVENIAYVQLSSTD